jgi:catechol 2,3-dioxygenase-like lactoylglutathione lyase family enzyme
MALRQIFIVSIPVADQAAARAFYVGVLGFEVLRDNPMGPDQRWIQLAPAGSTASITLVTWFPQMPAGTVQGLVLTTNAIDADHAALTVRGLAISDPADAPWGRYATFSDPDGNGWVLVQPAEGD